MAHQWGVEARNVACTKVAAKLAEPGLARSNYSLKPLLARHLGIEISKDEQTSDWGTPHLSPAQVEYALRDVEHLEALLLHLLNMVQRKGRLGLLEECFEFLPTYVGTRVSGVDDLFRH
jgi:ribonuclease D